VAADKKCDYMLTLTCSKAAEILALKDNWSKFREFVYADYTDPATRSKPFVDIPPKDPSTIIFYKKMAKL